MAFRAASALAFLLFSAIAMAAASPARRNTEKVTYNNCGSPSDVVQVKSLSISPTSGFAAGEQLAVTTTAQFTRAVKGGTVLIDGKLDGNPVFENTQDLCADLKATIGISCPVPAAATYTYVRHIVLPAVNSSDIFTVTTSATEEGTNDSLFCLEFVVDLTS